MWGIARKSGTLSAFSAFKDEGRHQSLKSDIRKRSFKGGSKKRWIPDLPTAVLVLEPELGLEPNPGLLALVMKLPV